MLKYNEMVECEKKYAFEQKQLLIEKYKAFLDYLKKVILLTFKDNEEQIVSYLKETSNQSLLLDWCVGGIHYVGFYIDVLDGKTLNIHSLRAHDSYYDPALNLESDITDEDRLSFFNHEYRHFVRIFVPSYQLADLHNVNKSGIDESYSVIYQIAIKFNEVCYKYFEDHFTLLGINDIGSFVKSKFSLSFTNERRRELDKEVYDNYNSYNEKTKELTKKFDKAVKDLK